MTFELTILGCNSAMPAHGRHLSAQVLQIGKELFLIDCGEGTQIRMMNFNIKGHRINHIFISHLHGDHIFGMIGMILSMGLSGRKNPLHIYCPEGLKPILDIQMEQEPAFEICYHHTDTECSTLLFENKAVEVYSIPLVHRVPCHGFLFVEKQRPANIIKEKIEEYHIPYSAITKIKAGGDFNCLDGRIIPHAELTIPAKKPRKYAYCSDTMYSEKIIPLIKGADLLYHEATFMHDLLEQAQKTKHSTAYQAASIAQQAKVKKLILGHFSSRYGDLQPLLEEAQAVFEQTAVAEEGKRVEL